jgi:hypothetical protein
MAGPRFRTRSVSGQEGSRHYVDGGVINPSDFYEKEMVCEDVVGFREQANPLNLHKVTRKVKLMKGTAHPFGFTVVFDNYRDDRTGLITPSHLDCGLGSIDIASKVLSMVAGTNPNRPSVSIPTFVGELKDLPAMARDIATDLRGAHRGLTRENRPKGRPGRTADEMMATSSWLGSKYIGFQFGWAPLVKDLKTLLSFQNSVSRKADEIGRLYKNGGLRRKREFGRATAHSDSTIVGLHSVLGIVIDGDEYSHTEERIWGSVRWVPTSLPPSSEPELRALAWKVATGLSLDPSNVLSTAWNLMPWSWLSDWYFQFGDFIDAHRNTVPVEARDICVMHRTVTRTKILRRNPSGHWPEITGGGGDITVDDKTRQVVGIPATSARTPFLSGRQWSILAALTAARGKAPAAKG